MDFEWGMVGVALLIMIARVADMSLGTLRALYVARQRTPWAFALAFSEMLIWVFAIAALISELDNALYALAFAFGYASGTVIGIRIEQRIATGDQVLRIFSRKGEELARLLRVAGARVTRFTGDGRDGPIDLLYVGSKRRGVKHLVEIAREHDPACFFTIDDLRAISSTDIGASSTPPKVAADE